MVHQCASVRPGSGLALALAVIVGCRGPGDSDPQRFVPSPAVAERVLRAVLQSWREGRPAGPIRSEGLTIEVSDSYRTPDRQLQSFAILGPVGPDNARGFAVKLALTDPTEEQVVRYLVIGTNPVWVFRLEDYERISHWEHKMDQEDDTAVADPPESPSRPER